MNIFWALEIGEPSCSELRPSSIHPAQISVPRQPRTSCGMQTSHWLPGTNFGDALWIQYEWWQPGSVVTKSDVLQVNKWTIHDRWLAFLESETLLVRCMLFPKYNLQLTCILFMHNSISFCKKPTVFQVCCNPHFPLAPPMWHCVMPCALAARKVRNGLKLSKCFASCWILTLVEVAMSYETRNHH